MSGDEVAVVFLANEPGMNESGEAGLDEWSVGKEAADFIRWQTRASSFCKQVHQTESGAVSFNRRIRDDIAKTDRAVEQRDLECVE